MLTKAHQDFVIRKEEEISRFETLLSLIRTCNIYIPLLFVGGRGRECSYATYSEACKSSERERERVSEFCKKHGVVKIINAGVSQTLNIPQNHSKIS